MSNPCINRWGLNVFWHHHWYSDSRYALNLRQDKLAITLIQNYLSFGSNVPTHFFWNPYWFKTQTAERPQESTKYYRWILAKSTALKSITRYRLRIESEEIFQTLVSVLKFNSWILINLYWFQPDKGRNRRLMQAKRFSRTLSTDVNSRSMSHITKWRKLTALSTIRSPSGTDLYLF